MRRRMVRRSRNRRMEDERTAQEVEDEKQLRMEGGRSRGRRSLEEMM